MSTVTLMKRMTVPRLILWVVMKLILYQVNLLFSCVNTPLIQSVFGIFRTMSVSLPFKVETEAMRAESSSC